MATKRALSRPGRYAVVVGFDFSSPSETALREALALAGRSPGGEVHLVYALDAEGNGVTKLDARIEKATAKLRAYVSTIHDELTAQANPSFLGMHVRVKGAAKAIVQASVDLDADLIVVGARHPAGFKGLLTSSTAAKVTKNARCPVLVVKPKNYAGLAKSPSVEPQCQACIAKRLETKGATWWCQRHADRIALPLHIYSYSYDHPMATRDADVEGAG